MPIFRNRRQNFINKKELRDDFSARGGTVSTVNQDANVDSANEIIFVDTVTDSPITLSGLQTVNGVNLAENNVVLVKDEADLTKNGVYSARSGTWVELGVIYNNIYRYVVVDGNENGNEYRLANRPYSIGGDKQFALTYSLQANGNNFIAKVRVDEQTIFNLGLTGFYELIPPVGVDKFILVDNIVMQWLGFDGTQTGANNEVTVRLFNGLAGGFDLHERFDTSDWGIYNKDYVSTPLLKDPLSTGVSLMNNVSVRLYPFDALLWDFNSNGGEWEFTIYYKIYEKPEL